MERTEAEEITEFGKSFEPSRAKNAKITKPKRPGHKVRPYVAPATEETLGPVDPFDECPCHLVGPAMKLASFEAIVRALNEAGVPFIVVGGIAVVHHGFGRVTQDVDLVVQLEKDVIRRTFAALHAAGYRPATPVTAEQFADPTMREIWQREKGMKVLRFWSDVHRETPLDVFINEPFDFPTEYARADVLQSSPGLEVRIVSLDSLLAMKRAAGRPLDLADIDELNLLHGRPSSYDSKS